MLSNDTKPKSFRLYKNQGGGSNAHVYPWWTSVWLLWPTITGVYLWLFFSSPLDRGAVKTYLTAAVGLLVPFGITSLLTPMTFLNVPLFLCGILVVNMIAQRHRLRIYQRLLVNLTFLLLITFIIDLLTTGTWSSLRFLIEGRLL